MFELWSSATSPFVRKVVVAAIETGRLYEIQLILVSTVDAESELNAANPLGKVPALAFENGTTLYDSRVISEFLDSRHAGPKLFPEYGAARWTALRRQALADGMADAAVLHRGENNRENVAQRSQEWIARQKQKMNQGLDALETDATGFGDGFDIGHLAIAVVLEYFDFRFGNEDWRANRPVLASWHARAAQRPSLQTTRPQA